MSVECTSELKKQGFCKNEATHLRESRIEINGKRDWFPCCAYCARLYHKRGIRAMTMTKAKMIKASIHVW